MAGAAVGPIYGPIPEVNAAWVIESSGSPLFSAEDTRELLRDAMGISGGYREMHKLSQAMNSTASISLLTVNKVKDMIVKWNALEVKISDLRSADPTDAGLPLIKADVVQYSEEPLKNKSLTQVKTQPLEEEQARLAIKICRAMNLELWDLPQAPCCGESVSGMAMVIRS